jgi:hypothetical protein
MNNSSPKLKIQFENAVFEKSFSPIAISNIEKQRMWYLAWDIVNKVLIKFVKIIPLRQHLPLRQKQHLPLWQELRYETTSRVLQECANLYQGNIESVSERHSVHLFSGFHIKNMKIDKNWHIWQETSCN